MKKFAIFISFFFFATQLFSQDLTKESVVGTWKVVDSKIIPEMQLELDANGIKEMEKLRKGFIGTIFYFEENTKFKIKFAENNSSFIKELEFLNNKNWKMGKGQRIKIGTTKDGYSLMEIIIRNKQGKRYFILEESPLILEVIQLTK